MENPQKITTIYAGCAFAEQWLPPITEEDKILLMYVLSGSHSKFGTPLLHKYISLLQPYLTVLGITGKSAQPREADCLASGIVFFYGCLFYIMHFPGWGRYIEDIFLYDLLYILVDHYIDDIRIDDALKQQAITQMFILIANPLAELPFIDPVLKTIAEVYHKLITHRPSTKSSINKLFLAEIESLQIQRSGEWSREKYYEIALKKGGCTMHVVQNIVGDIDPEITQASFNIGCIMQLIDDCADVQTDIQNNIHTIATHELRLNGNLDNIWVDIVDRIAHIDRRFTIFIILYNIFAIYLPDRLAQNYSPELLQQTNKINLFDYNYGCEGSTLLVNAIMTELTQMQLIPEIN